MLSRSSSFTATISSKGLHNALYTYTSPAPQNPPRKQPSLSNIPTKVPVPIPPPPHSNAQHSTLNSRVGKQNNQKLPLPRLPVPSPLPPGGGVVVHGHERGTNSSKASECVSEKEVCFRKLTVALTPFPHS